MIFGLWGRDELASDSGAVDNGGWEGITLAQNVTSSANVDATLRGAQKAGATIIRKGAPTKWGGYSGAFAEPDRHRWEVVFNPNWTIIEDRSTRLA